MIHLYTGNGKGKTTASLGLALRAVGDEKRVLMLQFIKGPWVSGEDNAQKYFPEDRFKIIKGGKGFVGIMGDKLPREEHKKAAQETLARAKKEISSGNWDIVILDEVNNAVELSLIKKTDVVELINNLPKNIDLILTGRNAPQEFVDAADLVTEMKDIKHPFYEGEEAKQGLEF